MRLTKRWLALGHNQSGITILELVLILVIIGILASLVALTYSGVRRNEHNQERQNDIQKVYGKLEAYYVVHSEYPTLADMNNTSWLQQNMPTLNREWLRDPGSSSYKLVAAPTKNAYAYQVTAADGGKCDNKTRLCAHYALTATLIGSAVKTYVKSSLN